MKRACCHYTYPNEPDMRDATFDIGIYQGHIYLKISKDVAASYHTKSSSKTYFSEVICTANDLLCTACECTVGPKKKQFYLALFLEHLIHWITRVINMSVSIVWQIYME